MKVLITGSKGQLGRTIMKLAPDFKSLNFTFTDVDQLDITNFDRLEKIFSNRQFDYVINCAAYTAVDKAEQDKEEATLINTTAAGYLATCSTRYNFRLIHLSTDFVFDGKKNRPYIETDKTGPLSVYAQTKADAEKLVSERSNRALIIRTSWLYSEFGHNFVKTIRKHALEKAELRIVSDQVGTPTFATDLAEMILNLISRNHSFKGIEIYNFSNLGVASWYDFAVAITELSGIECKIVPVATEEYPLPAKRPFYSVMSKDKLIRDFDYSIPHWRISLALCIELLRANESGS